MGVPTTPTGYGSSSRGGGDSYRRPPKFREVVSEYMGACLEENCQIGRNINNRHDLTLDAIFVEK